MKSNQVILWVGVCLFAFQAIANGALNWRHDPEGALREAKEAGRPVVLFFTAPWCGYCRMMDNMTFRDESVIAALEEYVAVKVDHDTYPMWVARYGVRGIPATMVLDETGRRVGRADGFLDVANFSRWLREVNGGEGDGLGGETLEELATALREGLQHEGEEIRANALASALTLYFGDDRAASDMARDQLREAQRKEPERFLVLLEDARLGVRILATNLYRQYWGEEFAFDPWAAEAERRAYLERIPEALANFR